MTESFLNKAKSALFFIVMLLLWFPLLQNTFVFFNEEPLGGAINNVEKPLYSYDSFLVGEYQNQLEEYQRSSFGFRNTMIRLNNQKMFSLYNIAKANGVIVGKKDYLFEEPYITAYLGLDFIGMEVVKSNVNKLLEVKQFLNEKGKDIIFVIAPGKASFYPEYIPDKYFKKEKGITNYEAYLKEFKANNINFVDFKAWFVENKNKSKYPLVPQLGVHWSKYGEYIATDSLIKYIERLRNIDLPDLVLDSVVFSKTPMFEDSDIGKGMNLFFEIPSFEMAYPYTHIEKREGQKSIKSLVIGDSFYWGLYYSAISRDIFDNGQFWYYNDNAYSSILNTPIKTENLDLNQIINENELFILLYSESNLVNFDYGFVNRVHRVMLEDKGDINSRIQYYINKINSSSEWLELMQIKAKDQNRELNDVILDDAKFMAKNEN